MRSDELMAPMYSEVSVFREGGVGRIERDGRCQCTSRLKVAVVCVVDGVGSGALQVGHVKDACSDGCPLAGLVDAAG